MRITVRSFGLLRELLKKDILEMYHFEKRAPLALKDILKEVGIGEYDFQWIAVVVNDVTVYEKDFGRFIEGENIDVMIYPVFAGG